MRKQLLNWKTIREVNVRGAEFDSRLPYIVDHLYRGTLLEQILAMRRGTAISFQDSMRILGKEEHEAFKRGEYKQTLWLCQNFVSWIAEQGYHIEITGDEFEPGQMTDKVS